MKSLLFTLLLGSPLAFGALDMKPGLWKIDLRINSEGKVVNPSDQAAQAMATMPAEEKQRIMRLIGNTSTVDQKGMTHVCYSKALIQKPEALGKPNEKCETSLVTNTTNKLVTNFKCQDGTVGDITLDTKEKVVLMGKVNLRDPKGKTSQVMYDGKFVADDCGKVKSVL